LVFLEINVVSDNNSATQGLGSQYPKIRSTIVDARRNGQTKKETLLLNYLINIVTHIRICLTL
jgi:hypothetical protein